MTIVVVTVIVIIVIVVIVIVLIVIVVIVIVVIVIMIINVAAYKRKHCMPVDELQTVYMIWIEVDISVQFSTCFCITRCLLSNRTSPCFCLLLVLCQNPRAFLMIAMLLITSHKH